MSDATSFFYVILFFVLIGGIVISIVGLIVLFKRWKEKGFKQAFYKGQREESMLPGLFDQPAERTEDQAIQPDSPYEAEGIATMLLCSRRDNLNPASTLKEAVAELKAGGAAASKALAQLIHDQLHSRTEGIRWSLHAARELEPTAELKEVLEKVASAPPLRQGDRGLFVPEIEGSNSVGWTDGTHNQIKGIAKKAIETLSGRRIPEVTSQSEPERSESKSVCSRCGAEAEWKFAISGQLVCSECFSEKGVCQGCGKKFSSDTELIKIGVRKSCKSCQPYFEQQLRRIDRKIDDFIKREPFKR